MKKVSGTGYYKRLLATKKDSLSSPAEKQIGLDLLRTLPNNKYYDKQNADGVSHSFTHFHHQDRRHVTHDGFHDLAGMSGKHQRQTM
jgi:hypothetical protein